MKSKVLKLVVLPIAAASAFFAFSSTTKASAPVNYAGTYKETDNEELNSYSHLKIKYASYDYNLKETYNKKTKITYDYVKKTSKIIPKGKSNYMGYIKATNVKTGKKVTFVGLRYGKNLNKYATIEVPNSTKFTVKWVN